MVCKRVGVSYNKKCNQQQKPDLQFSKDCNRMNVKGFLSMGNNNLFLGKNQSINKTFFFVVL